MKHFSILLSFILLVTSALHTQEVLSPNKNIKVTLVTKKTSNQMSFGRVYFRILYKEGSSYGEVLPSSHLGISRTDQYFVDSLSFIGESNATDIHDKYEMICGKRNMCEYFGTEKVFSYKNSNNQPLDIIFRVYNNGVAFRYVFPDHSDSFVNVTSEATTYVLPDSTYRWIQPYSIAYEDFFPLSKTGLSQKKEKEWGLPALFKVNNESLWVLISEANISENNCSTFLDNSAKPNEYRVTYPSQRKEYKQVGVILNR